MKHLKVLRRARRVNGNDREVAVSQLIVEAFFFAMRSCEYSCVQGKRMTTVVGVEDIRFWANDEIVDADDSEGMRRADAVSVTFRRQQKNRDNGVLVTQHRTDKTGDAEMCPVKALAALVSRIRSYALVKTRGTTNVGINAVGSGNGDGLEGILSKEVLK